jgi:ketosteroid isomerase-like protein
MMSGAWYPAIGLALATTFAPGSVRQADVSHVPALRRMIATVNAGDAAGYARLYSPDAVITIYGGESIKGRAAIERYEAALIREFPGTRLAFYAVWQAPSATVVHYGVNGRTATGDPMGHEGLLFFRFNRSGAIVEERRYLDSLTPMAQLGAFGKQPARALPVLPDELTSHSAQNSATETNNLAIVRSALAAIDSNNSNTFFALSAATISIDEVTLREPLPGLSNAKRWFDVWSAARNMTTDVTLMLAVGDHVLVETTTRGTLSGSIGRVTASGKPFSVHRAFVVQMRDGAIVRLISFMNGKELAEATGQWPLR